jgi:hypothetical protein
MAFGSSRTRTSSEEQRGRSTEPIPLMESKVCDTELRTGLDPTNKAISATNKLLLQRVLDPVYGIFHNQSFPLLVQGRTSASKQRYLLWPPFKPVPLWRPFSG